MRGSFAGTRKLDVWKSVRRRRIGKLDKLNVRDAAEAE